LSLVAVSDSPTEFIRVSEVPTDVKNSEVNFIAWLLLEKEFGVSGTTFKEEDSDQDSFGRVGLVSSDTTDAFSSRIQADGHRNHRSLSRKEQALRCEYTQYTNLNSQSNLIRIKLTILVHCSLRRCRRSLGGCWCKYSFLATEPRAET